MADRPQSFRRPRRQCHASRRPCARSPAAASAPPSPASRPASRPAIWTICRIVPDRRGMHVNRDMGQIGRYARCPDLTVCIPQRGELRQCLKYPKPCGRSKTLAELLMYPDIPVRTRKRWRGGRCDSRHRSVSSNSAKRSTCGDLAVSVTETPSGWATTRKPANRSPSPPVVGAIQTKAKLLNGGEV